MPRIGFVTLLAAAAALVASFLLPMRIDGEPQEEIAHPHTRKMRVGDLKTVQSA